MIFSKGADSITVETPEYGYTVSVEMRIDIQPAEDNTYPDPWDNGVAYDTRVLECSFLLNKTQSDLLQAFFKTAGRGRCELINIELGTEPTGFYPAGPDKGDVGTFAVQAIDIQQGPALVPFKDWVRTKIKFCIISTPEYTIPEQVEQGNFTIGDVGGLMQSPDGYDITALRNFSATRTTVAYFVDGATSGDTWENSFTQRANASSMAALLNYLTGPDGRNQDISIVAPSGFYIFGGEQGGAGTYNTKLLKNVLTVTHERYDGFSLPLSFWMKAKTA